MMNLQVCPQCNSEVITIEKTKYGYVVQCVICGFSSYPFEVEDRAVKWWNSIKFIKCKWCDGTGYKQQQKDTYGPIKKCKFCNGTGHIIKFKSDGKQI